MSMTQLKIKQFQVKIVQHIIWKKANVMAQRAISTVPTRKTLLKIMNFETAKDIWMALKSKYKQKSESKLLEVVQKLRNQNNSFLILWWFRKCLI